MTQVKLSAAVPGPFAENKDAARAARLEQIVPALDRGEEVVLDFGGIESATQSFVHALISDLFRRYGADVLDRLVFKNCTENVKKIISIVVDYMQEGS